MEELLNWMEYIEDVRQKKESPVFAKGYSCDCFVCHTRKCR